MWKTIGAIAALCAALAGCNCSPPDAQPTDKAIASAAMQYIDKVATTAPDSGGCTLMGAAVTLAQYGLEVMPDSTGWDHWSWSAPTTGTHVQYYVARAQFPAGSDTTATLLIKSLAGAYWMQVKGVDAEGRSGPWSQLGWNNDNTPLPGVSGEVGK